MKNGFLIYVIICIVVCVIAGQFTDFNKSYWIGFVVASVLDIAHRALKTDD